MKWSLKINTKITNRDSFTIDKYLREINRISMISESEEEVLSKESKNWSQQALVKLVEANLRFVVSVAKQYQNQWLPLNDLINEGNIWLIQAIQKFDETKGFKLISYAVRWIRQSILSALSSQVRHVRLPQNKVIQHTHIKKCDQDFMQIHEREATDDELAEILNMNTNDFIEIKNWLLHQYSIDTPIWEEGITYEDIIITDIETDKDLIDWSEHEELRKAINKLTTKEAEVIKYYFWFTDLQQNYSLEDIGVKMGLTRKCVRKLKNKAVNKIRKYIKENNELPITSYTKNSIPNKKKLIHTHDDQNPFTKEKGKIFAETLFDKHKEQSKATSDSERDPKITLTKESSIISDIIFQREQKIYNQQTLTKDDLINMKHESPIDTYYAIYTILIQSIKKVRSIISLSQLKTFRIW